MKGNRKGGSLPRVKLISPNVILVRRAKLYCSFLETLKHSTSLSLHHELYVSIGEEKKMDIKGVGMGERVEGWVGR